LALNNRTYKLIGEKCQDLNCPDVVMAIFTSWFFLVDRFWAYLRRLGFGNPFFSEIRTKKKLPPFQEGAFKKR